MRRNGVRASALASAVAVAATLLAGCGGSGSPPIAKPLPTAPEPANSPPASPNPAGLIVAEAGAPEGVAITADGTVGVNVRDPDALMVFNLSQPHVQKRVLLTGSARHLTLAAPAGPFLVPQESDDLFVEVAASNAAIEAAIPVGRQPHDAIAVGSGFFVADELANTIHIVNGGHVVRVVAAPLQPGGMAESADGTRALVVGVRGRRISEYTSAGKLIGTANSGAGPTHAVAGTAGLYWVADTNGGAILGFRLGSKGPVQVATIPVGPQPYGLAYDGTRKTLWVTLTGSNQLIGLHLDGTTVKSTTRYDTVRQPNTVAVDETSGKLVVTGSTEPGAIEIIG